MFQSVLEMGEKFVENDFFEDLGQKWGGSLSRFLSSDGFFRGLTTAVFRLRGTLSVIRDDCFLPRMVLKF